MFRLGLLSFATNHNMDAIRQLAAFGWLEELKALQPPCHPTSAFFKPHAPPTLESLLDFIAADYPVFEPTFTQSKCRQDLAREKYRCLCEAEGRNLAHFFLEQWPSSEPLVGELGSIVIDIELALERILPE